MKLLCDKEAKRDVIDKLEILCHAEQKATLHGYRCVHENLMFYVEEAGKEMSLRFFIKQRRSLGIFFLRRNANAVLRQDFIAVKTL